MSYRGAMSDGVSAHRRVVKRFVNCPVPTIAVVADGKCFRKHEAYATWDAGDPTRGPAYVVDLDHIGHLFPGSHAVRAREKVGRFEFQAVTVELLISKEVRWQDWRFARTGILDLP